MVGTGMDVFDIVILGFDRSRPDSPAAGLQRVFPIDQGTAVRLINALPATVKRAVPKASAEQYEAALIAIGARVELRKSEPKPEPKPEPKTEPTPATASHDAATKPDLVAPVIASSRFAGAATLKHGSPLDSAPPLPSATQPSGAAHLPTERPPAGEVDALPPVATFVPEDRPKAQPANASAPPEPAPASEQWGGLVAAPKPKAAAVVAGNAAKSSPPPPSDEREENRRELFRRLMDPRQTGPAELSPAEAAGGISVLELDLPPPRAGWASPDTATLGADETPAPTTALDRLRGSATDDPRDLPPLVTEAPPPISLASQRPAVEVFEPPADTRSFNEALPDALALSLRDGGAKWVLLISGVGLAVTFVTFLLNAHPAVATVLGFASVVVLLGLASEQAVVTLRAVVDDLGSPDAPDLRGDDFGRYVSAGFNLFFVGLVTQLPFLGWLVRHRDQLPGALSSEPLGLLFLIVSAFYWPIAVGLQAISENPLSVWQFARGVRVILAAPVEYATLVLSAAIMALLPLGLSLLLVRMGLPSELCWLGIAVGLSLSQGATAALIGHLARVQPRAFEDR